MGGTGRPPHGAVLAAGTGRAGRAGPGHAADDPVGPPPAALAPRGWRPGPRRGGLARTAGRPDRLPDRLVAECLAARAGPPGDGGPAHAPAQDEALTRIARAAERARYARDPADSAGLRADTDQVRRALAGHATRPGALAGPAARRRPHCAPARTALQHAMDVFGWMDVAAHRLSAIVRRARRGVRQGPGLSAGQVLLGSISNRMEVSVTRSGAEGPRARLD